MLNSKAQKRVYFFFCYFPFKVGYSTILLEFENLLVIHEALVMQMDNISLSGKGEA